MNIFTGGGYIDFYVNPKKYNSYKTDKGKRNFVNRELRKILTSLTKQVHHCIEIRQANITSNNFWRIKKFTTINDIGYNCNNPLPLNEEKLTIRISLIDLIGVVLDNENYSPFPTIKGKNFMLKISHSKII